MRRLSIAVAGCASVAVLAGWPFGASMPALPLHTPPAATNPLLALASTGHGSKLEQLDPASFTPLRASVQVGWYDGWVISPDRKMLALATHSDASNVDVSTLRFGNVSTLRWVRRGVRLDGYFRAAIWPREGMLYVLAGNCCGSGGALDTIDTVSKRVVARTSIAGQIAAVARSSDGLVSLTETDNAVAPATLIVIGADGIVRAVPLGRIVAGTHFDQTSQDPIGTTRQPGLAVDPNSDTAYVIDDSGLVGQIGLRDLSVSYHQLGGGSLIARLSGWLTPPAEAKGLNGPMLTAQWLGDGLIALTGTSESAVKQKDGSTVFSSTPAGIRLVDTNAWSERTLDPGSDSAVVADGLLLASGGSWRSDGNTTTSSGEGLAAYGPDETLRWHIDAGETITVLAAYGSRALIQKVHTGPYYIQEPVQLIDLTTGRALRTLPADSYPWPLLGTGS
jgi:hypothetical protein